MLNNIPRNPPFSYFASFLIVSLTPFGNNPDADAANPNGIKALLGNGFNTFLIKGNPIFNNGPESLPKNPPDCPILCK